MVAMGNLNGDAAYPCDAGADADAADQAEEEPCAGPEMDPRKAQSGWTAALESGLYSVGPARASIRLFLLASSSFPSTRFAVPLATGTVPAPLVVALTPLALLPALSRLHSAMALSLCAICTDTLMVLGFIDMVPIPNPSSCTDLFLGVTAPDPMPDPDPDPEPDLESELKEDSLVSPTGGRRLPSVEEDETVVPPAYPACLSIPAISSS